MAVSVYAWSTTASSNGSASSAVNFAEGQTPASLNNSNRAQMAEIAAWLLALGGGVTYGGSSSDYTVTNSTPGVWSAYATGQVIALKANHTNDDTTVNINVDGLGNKRIKTNDGGDPAIGDIVSGGIYLLAYDGTNFQILNTIAGGSYQPLDGDLTAIAALGYTSGTEIPRKTAANTWEIVNDNLYAHLAGAETITGLKTVNVGVQALRFNNNNFIFHGTTGGRSLLAGAPSNVTYAWYVYSAADAFERQIMSVTLSTGVMDFLIQPTINSAAIRAAGKTAIPIPASAMVSNTTNGAAPGTSESTTNKVMTRTLDFDQTTQEGAQFLIPMPKSWNESTVTFQPIWTAAAGTAAQTVVWELRAVALSDDDAIDAAFGTGQTSSDALIAVGDVHIGPESSAITIAGAPAEGDLVVFQIRRNVASDDLAADAKLLGVRLFITTNAANDA